VLELGAGNGAAAGRLASLEPSIPSIVCIDFSPSALRSFPRRLSADGRISKVASDARKLPFHEGAFDFVLARHILTHVAPGVEVELLSEARRVMRDGAGIYIEVFAPGDVRNRTGGNCEERESRDGGLVWRFYDASSLMDAVESAGLEVDTSKVVSRSVTFDAVRYPRESIVCLAHRTSG
jgi:ubiquinone/menaquinone biosynthesis C-methylase UbiE